MKAFVITLAMVAVLVGGAWALGWVKFSESNSKPAVEVDKAKVEADTEKAAQATKHTAKKIAVETKEAAQKIGEETKEAVEKLKNSTEDEKADAEESLDSGGEKIEDQAENVDKEAGANNR